jgi:hypothetical protein
MAASGQSFEGIHANVNRASKSMRLFNDQVETMAKLKGKSGQQRVVVEHVNVEAGGQAIVGVLPGGQVANALQLISEPDPWRLARYCRSREPGVIHPRF